MGAKAASDKFASKSPARRCDNRGPAPFLPEEFKHWVCVFLEGATTLGTR